MGSQTQTRSPDSRGGGLGLATHAIPTKRKTKTRLKTPGAGRGCFSPRGLRAQAPHFLPSNPSRISENNSQASARPFPASNLAFHSLVESVSALARRLAKLWGGLNSAKSRLAFGRRITIFHCSRPGIRAAVIQFTDIWQQQTIFVAAWRSIITATCAWCWTCSTARRATCARLCRRPSAASAPASPPTCGSAPPKKSSRCR